MMMSTNAQAESASSASLQEEIPIESFGPVEFYVGNARQAAYFYQQALGFDRVAYRGPETGCRDFVSYVMKQNRIEFVLTAALTDDHPISEHVKRHGDGIKDVCFVVDDVERAFEIACSRGAKPVVRPETRQDEYGTIKLASIQTYGDTTHTFMNKKAYKGPFLPLYIEKKRLGQPIGLQFVDHMVGNVESGKMEDWVKFYESILGFFVFRHYDEHDISTQYSALTSKVMANKALSVKMPINQPAQGVGKSQIQEFIDYYKSAGVQHLAIHTEDILRTVSELRRRGVELMTVPESYYDSIRERVGDIEESVRELADLGILVDREGDGYLLQIFTMPVQDRPTFFFEIIQRKGADGFGKGNFKALFEAIERDQQQRGNL